MTTVSEEYLQSALEALLFVSDEPVAVSDMAAIVDADGFAVRAALKRLQEEKREQNAGIQLREVASGWQLVTHAEHHDLIEKYVRSWDMRKLSAAAMETLAIIAYMQPVTRTQVAAVRGVTSDSAINSLVEKNLVREVGTADTPGNPILYGTTRTFLDSFGLKTLDEMTDLAEFAPDEETEKLIRRRLSSTREETGLTDEEAAELAQAMLAENGADIQVEGAEDGNEALREMMRDALSSTAGVVDKIDFDSLVFDTDDE